MKFLTIFSTLLASGTALAAYVPQAGAARGLSADNNEFVNRISEIQGGAKEHANPVGSFFDELKHTATPDDKTTEKLDSRDLVGNMFGSLVGTNAIDFNEKIGHGFNVTATYVSSIDFNAQANAGIEYVSKKLSSSSNIPGASIMVAFLSGLKALVAKFDLNAMAQSCMSGLGQLISSIDFNALVAGGVKLYKTVSQSLKETMQQS